MSCVDTTTIHLHFFYLIFLSAYINSEGKLGYLMDAELLPAGGPESAGPPRQMKRRSDGFESLAGY